jgi:hypothetical protein
MDGRHFVLMARRLPSQSRRRSASPASICHTTGWGSVPYWNVRRHPRDHGQGTFFDPRLDDAAVRLPRVSVLVTARTKKRSRRSCRLALQLSLGRLTTRQLRPRGGKAR